MNNVGILREIVLELVLFLIFRWHVFHYSVKHVKLAVLGQVVHNKGLFKNVSFDFIAHHSHVLGVNRQVEILGEATAVIVV